VVEVEISDRTPGQSLKCSVIEFLFIYHFV